MLWRITFLIGQCVVGVDVVVVDIAVGVVVGVAVGVVGVEIIIEIVILIEIIFQRRLPCDDRLWRVNFIDLFVSRRHIVVLLNG